MFRISVQNDTSYISFPDHFLVYDYIVAFPALVYPFAFVHHLCIAFRASHFNHDLFLLM